ncbi:hypothetical protein C5167_033645 [Papaver somniferum]|uniref:Phosphoribulokinase/uridine kinase domain-containing protein n=1 Tax=Papaver somniferum TaxID=3469 RepID=A0A4Y7KF17_PAPSO|nr:hypothetical protein C5167_033645 [Papaver somniferum]
MAPWINSEASKPHLISCESPPVSLVLFFGADADVRLARRIRQDTVEKGREIGQVLDQYPKFVKLAFEAFILPTKKYVPMEEIIMLRLI